MQVLKIKNYLLNVDPGNEEWKSQIVPTLPDYLFNLPLAGKLSWNRTKFVNKFLVEDAKRIAEERQKLLEKHCEKNKEGQLIYLDEKGKDTTDPKKSKQYKVKDIKKLSEEMNELLNDELVIDITPANSQLIADVRQAMENDPIPYKAMAGARYAEYCQALEPVEAELGKKEEIKK